MNEAVNQGPVVLRALGRKSLPDSILLAAGRYHFVRLFKHDFFALTALFERADGHRVVLKVGRTADILGLPAGWIGRWLTAREARIYRALAHLPQVPAFAGMWGRSGFAHEYVPGHPLGPNEPVADDFFDQLDTLISQIHSQRMAYVDLEKSENIIVATDGKPVLIDFQISWDVPRAWMRRLPVVSSLTKLLQHMDRYHLIKHRRRYRPDQLSAQILDGFKAPWFIRLHRAVVRPLQKIRRGTLRRVDPGFDSAPR